MKKEFTTSNGSKGMIIDCENYEVEIFKTVDKDYFGDFIKYIDKKTGYARFTAPVFQIDWDEEKDGGKLELKHRDRWGSEMNFVHYWPTDLKGMFDFIGKGYNIFNNGFADLILSLNKSKENE